MPSFSEVDWEAGSAFDTLQKHGFFAYSGADGDLFRRNGTAGWRVSVRGGHSIRVQEKTAEYPDGNVWATRRAWVTENSANFDQPLGDLPQEALDEFTDVIETLVEEGEIEKQPRKVYDDVDRGSPTV